jgi:hypothetical protein
MAQEPKKPEKAFKNTVRFNLTKPDNIWHKVYRFSAYERVFE